MSTYEQRGKWRFDKQVKGTRLRGWWYASKLEAMQAEEEAVKQFEETQQINTGFFQLSNARLDSIAKLSPSHRDRNKRLLRRLNHRWQNKRTIKRLDVENYLNEVANTHSTARAIRELRLIRALFRYGVELGIWPNNPTRGIKLKGGNSVKRYVPPPEDVKKVLAAATKRQLPYLLTIIYTLARVNAINQLKWEDIHEDYLILRTRKARDSKEKDVYIPLSDKLKQVLAAIPRRSKYVFCNIKTGRPYKTRLKMIHHLCDKAGVPHFTFHALRHYAASHLVKQGVALTDVQQLLGHEKVTTTAIYLRALGSGVKEAVKKLEGIG